MSLTLLCTLATFSGAHVQETVIVLELKVPAVRFTARGLHSARPRRHCGGGAARVLATRTFIPSILTCPPMEWG